jgi:diguanylate cyclase (GGDEF)-like protein
MDDLLISRLTRQLSEAVEMADFESRLAKALEMAQGQPDVINVIERSFSSALPDSPVELLLADSSQSPLLRMAVASPTGMPPGCQVDSPDHCPAARLSKVQLFPDSEAFDVCPKLRDRAGGAVSALCVPVSISGHAVGVIHATGALHASFAKKGVHELEVLSKLAGAKIGLLRVMTETQLQAATDSLTGLLNRRSFERQISSVRRGEVLLSVAMVDLDDFKSLNDSYGHEMGDRALQLFAQVLTESVRSQDLVCRHGGEEFIVALLGCAKESLREIFDALSIRLEAAITVAGLPRFTASCGVVEAGPHEDLAAVVARADMALFQAKREGRDRVVIHDASGEEVPLPSGLREVIDLDNGRLFRQWDPFTGADTNDQ